MLFIGCRYFKESYIFIMLAKIKFWPLQLFNIENELLQYLPQLIGQTYDIAA